MGGIKGSSPGTVSSVRPAREFGALARKAGVSGAVVEGETAERSEVGEVVQVQPGELINCIEVPCRFNIVGSTAGGGCFCSMNVPRHDSISSSSSGVAERRPKGDLP